MYASYLWTGTIKYQWASSSSTYLYNDWVHTTSIWFGNKKIYKQAYGICSVTIIAIATYTLSPKLYHCINEPVRCYSLFIYTLFIIQLFSVIDQSYLIESLIRPTWFFTRQKKKWWDNQSYLIESIIYAWAFIWQKKKKMVGVISGIYKDHKMKVWGLVTFKCHVDI